MKRLAKFLRSMDNNTSTYTEMYEGSLLVHDPNSPDREPEPDSEPIYYAEDIGYEITHTHKLAQDKPTVTIHIPAAKLGLKSYDQQTAAFCFNAFHRYADSLNEELYNRSRPDNENGKYILPEVMSVAICSNFAFFAVRMNRWYENAGGNHVWMLTGEDAPKMEMTLHFRIQVQLPMKKLRKTIQMLCRDLPEAVERFIAEFDNAGYCHAVECARKQAEIRAWLKTSDCCAFVANGSILPRQKGTELPMENAVPFRSTPHDEIEICGVKGMGIRKGVTVITGGGYSGKSTLLDAISAGIYDHVPGDGRELCITDSSAVTIAAEDGRSVRHVNISPFIKWLPGGDTGDFSTDHASGSTSQAANIMEAVEDGAHLLLIDEDRSATNFMIRDSKMKELISREPITPFTDRVRELSGQNGVSTILVIGGSGEYLSVADRVYMMEDYQVSDVTERARRLCAKERTAEIPAAPDWRQSRVLCSERFSPYPEGMGSEKLEVSDMGFILIGDERIDVRGLSNLATHRQLVALSFMLRYLEITNKDRVIDLNRRIDELYTRIETEGMDFLYSPFFTTCERFLDLPRRQELTAILNRMRKVRFIRSSRSGDTDSE